MLFNVTAIDTIGPSAGASILKSQPGLGSPRKNGSNSHQSANPMFERYPPGTSIVEDDDDPVHESDEDEGEGDSDDDEDLYDPNNHRTASGLPQASAQQIPPYGPSITTYGLSEHPTEPAFRQRRFNNESSNQRPSPMQHQQGYDERQSQSHGVQVTPAVSSPTLTFRLPLCPQLCESNLYCI